MNHVTMKHKKDQRPVTRKVRPYQQCIMTDTKCIENICISLGIVPLFCSASYAIICTYMREKSRIWNKKAVIKRTSISHISR